MALSISTVSLPSMTLNQAVSATLAAIGSAGPYVWEAGIVAPGVSAAFKGHLPKGVELLSNGVLTGSPKQAGAYSVTIAVGSTSSGDTAYKTFSGVVDVGALVDAEGAGVDPSDPGRLVWVRLDALPRFTIDVGAGLKVVDVAQMGGLGKTFVRIPHSDARIIESDHCGEIVSALPLTVVNYFNQFAY